MKIFVFIAGLLFPFLLHAQQITGKVTNEKKEPLVGANVYWLGNTHNSTTNEEGVFGITIPATGTGHKLIASYAGYIADTILITSGQTIVFELREKQKLNEVVVNADKEGIINSNRSIIKMEQITLTELRKSACCDLAGCFETQLTVQPQTTNIITNSKELRILGLSGVYNQVLIDGLPMIQGLSYTYGISSVPGTLVENIYVSKGANSVIQGYESISGQINVETKKPGHTDKLLLNVYMNSFMEKHFNVNYNFKLGKWNNLTAFQTVQPANRTDGDKDGFLDLPLLTRYMLSSKWKYGNEREWGWHSTIGLRYLHEQRIGGQTTFNADQDKGSASVYGQAVGIRQPELTIKTGYRFNDKQHLVLHVSSFHHNQDAYFGLLQYKARQTNIYANIQHELNYGNHDVKWGISFRHLNLDENIRFTPATLVRTYADNYKKTENIPGLFTENTMRFFNNKLTWIAGVRGDFHNEAGFMFTPRTLVKYDFGPNTVVRANIGTGWRTVNLFSENINLLASSRDIIFMEKLNPEKAMNTGINFTQKFKTSDDFSGTLSIDFYHTRFQNQVFPDYDTDPTKAYIKNFTGKSISNGFQAELLFNVWQRVAFKTGYTYLDVYQVINNVKQLLPFNPAHKVLSTISYNTVNNKFHADVNIHWYGKQRLPDTKANPVLYQRPGFSKPYTTVNAQVTYNFKKVEVYAGCENIFNYRQRQPIISWQDPFGPYFDTSSVWGPTRGREGYIGVRFIIPKK
jgi:outer membrane receptor for ferrienterochelin and colicins